MSICNKDLTLTSILYWNTRSPPWKCHKITLFCVHFSGGSLWITRWYLKNNSAVLGKDCWNSTSLGSDRTSFICVITEIEEIFHDCTLVTSPKHNNDNIICNSCNYYCNYCKWDTYFNKFYWLSKLGTLEINAKFYWILFQFQKRTGIISFDIGQ